MQEQLVQRSAAYLLAMQPSKRQVRGTSWWAALHWLVLVGTSWYWLVLSWLVLVGTGWYWLVLAGTIWYRLVLAGTAWY